MDRTPRHQDRLRSLHDPSSAVTVVVGIDGSESSWDAFWWASGQAQRQHGRVVAAFVSPTVETSLLATSMALSASSCDHAAFDQIATEQAERLRHQLEGYATDHDIPFTFVRARGDATTELLHVADKYHADLIVIGKSTKARHHLAGSLGKRLIGKRNAPVVVVVP
jgi:nucleotide-binding universal stress UspA family protein